MIAKLTVPWPEFLDTLNGFITKGNEIVELRANTVNELDILQEKYKIWKEDCVKFLESTFDDKNNDYKDEFRTAGAGAGFRVPGAAPPNVQHQVSAIRDSVRDKNFTLYGFSQLLKVCEAIIQPDAINLNERNNFSIEQKLSLILDKLSLIQDDMYYPIQEILVGNGIILRRENEVRELAKILEDRDLVETLGGIGSGMNARLTMRGAMALEESNKAYRENYDDIKLTSDDLENKVNAIIDHLNTMGLGQEILFNELQELKEMYTKLNKKNWGQLLKGKLVDLALGKLVENDTLSYIYHSLTEHTLQLPNFK